MKSDEEIFVAEKLVWPGKPFGIFVFPEPNTEKPQGAKKCEPGAKKCGVKWMKRKGLKYKNVAIYAVNTAT